MSSSEESKKSPPPPPADVESQHDPPPATGQDNLSENVQGWNSEYLIKRGCVALRGFALLFSFLSIVIMASNKHGDGRNFDQYEEYRYVLAIAVLSFLYTGTQSWKQIHELSTGKVIVDRQKAALIDFFGDQIVAYLLISSASAAIPMTNRIREGADNIFTDSCSSSISMSFFAFLSLALSAMVAGYNLAIGSYI